MLLTCNNLYLFHEPSVVNDFWGVCFPCRKYQDAAEAAFAQKSEEGLDLVLTKCASSNRPLVNRIQEMKTHLRQRR